MEQKVYDFDIYKEVRSYYAGNGGDKKSILIDGKKWMVKYPQNVKDKNTISMSYTTSPLSEYISSHVYDILGYPVHNTIIGVSSGKVCVGCYDYTNDIKEPTMDMKSLTNYAFGYEKEAEREAVSSQNKDNHAVDLGQLLYTLDNVPNWTQDEKEMCKERFWDMFVIDSIVSNSDRHNGNWGIYEEDGVMKLLPVYDNGNSWLGKHNDEEIKELLENSDKYNSLLHAGNTPFVYNDKRVDSLTTVKKLSLGYGIINTDLKQAIQRVAPKIERHEKEIIDFILSIPEHYRGITIITPERKQVYERLFMDRCKKILEPAFEKANQLDRPKIKINNSIGKNKAQDKGYER